MARQLRIEFPGAIYHVMDRGMADIKLFQEPRDYESYKERLRKWIVMFNIDLYAYCLMPTHYHLFISTREGNLSHAMQWLGTAYSVWYNNKHERSGHLFRGRYKALIIENDAYFSAVSRYIHLNPVRGGLVECPEQWAWSSYAGYWHAMQMEDFISYERILNSMDENDMHAARLRYREFVDAGIRDETFDPWRAAWHGFILGSEDFVSRIAEMVALPIGKNERDIPLLKRLRQQVTLTHVLEVIAVETGASIDDLLAPRRRRHSRARQVAIFLCRYLCGMKGREIARLFGGVSESNISRNMKRVNEKDPLVRKALNRLGAKIDGVGRRKN